MTATANTPVFYRSISPASMVPVLCRAAHNLGFELVPFNGYDDSMTRDFITANTAAMNEITETVATPATGTAIEMMRPVRTFIEDEEASAVVRAYTN